MSGQKHFNKIYNEYHKMVRNVLFNMTGQDVLDDLTQETFIRIWAGLPRFALRSSIQTWIYRITVNTATDHLRKKKSMNNLDSELKEKSTENSSPEVSYTEIISEALSGLEDDFRVVVVLFYFEELSIKQIAKILELPEGTVKSRMHNAKKKMQDFFSKKGVSL